VFNFCRKIENSKENTHNTSESRKKSTIKTKITCRSILVLPLQDRVASPFTSSSVACTNVGCMKCPCTHVGIIIYVTVQNDSFLSDPHKKRSPTQSDIYQRLYWYNWFSWWWAQGCSKHVENWNKHTEKNCASSWSFTKNHNEIQGQKNIKFSLQNACSFSVL